MIGKRQAKDSSSIQSVERALDILFLLADAKAPVTVSEIAAQLGVHNSTASRLLATLHRQNLVVQSREGFRLGLGLLRLTHVVLNELTLRTVASPHLRRLNQQTGHSVYLATLFEGDELYIDQVESEETLLSTSWIGRMIPPHTASSGKVLLAYLSETELQDYIERGLTPSTRYTVTDPAILREQLEFIREYGYIVSRDEHLIGSSSAAAPIFDRTRKNVAVVALALPTNQTSDEALRSEIAPLVMATANSISVELGFDWLDKGLHAHDSRH